ncbi:MAG: outer membrane lipoprotein chaperone LolA [Bacteroidota bacterium]
MVANFITLLFLLVYNYSVQSGNELLKRIQNEFRSFENFSAQFTQIIYDEQGKSTGRTSGKFTYKKKNKFIVELKNSSIVSNGETIWNYDKKLKRVVISYFDDEPTSFSLDRFVFDYPALCRTRSVKIDEPNQQLLELIPKDENLNFKSIKIWVGESYFINKLEIVDLSDLKFTIQISDVKKNQDISDSKFTFYPPKGIQIIDLR